MPSVSTSSLPDSGSVLPMVSAAKSLPCIPDVHVSQLPSPYFPTHKSNKVAFLSMPSTSTTIVVRNSSNDFVPDQTSPDTNTKLSNSAFIKVSDRVSYSSPSFSLLTVPTFKKKKQGTNYRQKLPKALAGFEAIKIIKD